MSQEYDLAILGAGSGGLTAAGFAARLGARVVLIEKHRVGGDCTWSGCVPSKALLKAAKVAHECRTSSVYGIQAPPPQADMAKVRDYVRRSIQRAYAFEAPEELRRQGIDVVIGGARFEDPRTVTAGEQTIRAKTFLITTGARPRVPAIAGLDQVPFLTYEQIFENLVLPHRLVVVGGGPVGVELSQAYRRLGSQVTVVAERLLPKDEPEAHERLERVFADEGIRVVRARAQAVRKEGAGVTVQAGGEEVHGDMLLIAAGRRPNLAGLGLEKAGVQFSENGIPVDDQLRTNVQNIYAAGDVLGGHQFTHFAGWQAFQAVRNAMLPGHSSGFTDVVPWVTFTDPEVAHVGLTEVQARAKFGEVRVCQWEMQHADRAICENDEAGFLKIVAREDGRLLGATIVAARAGEAITEFVLALKHDWKVSDLASAIHAYPTYSTPVQQLASAMTIDTLVSGASGRILLGLSKIIR